MMTSGDVEVQKLVERFEPIIQVGPFEKTASAADTFRQVKATVEVKYLNVNAHGGSSMRVLTLEATQVVETPEYMDRVALPEVLNTKCSTLSCVDLTLISTYLLKWENTCRIVGKTLQDLDKEAPGWEEKALGRWARYVTFFELANPLLSVQFLSGGLEAPAFRDPFMYPSREAMYRGMHEKQNIRESARTSLPSFLL
jgi:hypothetical protein